MFRSIVAPCLLVCVLMSVSPGGVFGDSLTAWYRQPVEKWHDGMPLGNGRIGCMVFGGVERERIQFNEDSLWTGDENPSGNYDTMGAYQNFGDLFLELGGDSPASGPIHPNAQPGEALTSEAGDYMRTLTSGEALGKSSTPKDQAESNYKRSLSLGDAVARVVFKKDGVTHTRETFASYPDQVIAIRWSADRPGALSGRIRLQGAHGEKTAVEGDTFGFAGKLSNGLEYEARARAIVKGGALKPDGETLQLDKCDEVVVLLALGTNYAMDYAKHWRGDNPAERVRMQLDTASKQSWDELLRRHTGDYRKLFGRVTAVWGQSAPEVQAKPTDERLKAYAAAVEANRDAADPELEQLLFQFGRYLLIASSRRPGLPANLQGLWNDSNKPAWSSDYHTNINIQMNYWPAETANLSECHLPLFDLIMAMREPMRQATRAAFGEKTRGWTARTSHNIFGGLGWEWNIPSNAWYALHFYEHYAFTGDTEFLRATAYPMLKEVCEYWEDQLKTLPDGTLVVPNGWSPEHGPREDGVAHDQQIVWDLFTNYLEASEALGVDADYRQTITAKREKLAGPKTGKWGQLQEWMADRDDPKDQHRHTSHLFAVYPGRQISVAKTPEWAQAAAKSLEARGTSGDSRREWVWAWRCALWARLREGDRAHSMLRNLLAYNTLPSLLGVHPPVQMDGNYGITAGICEMLLQSHAGEIDLLPALPQAWSHGAMKGLRARNGVEVDLTWENGTLKQAFLRAEKDGSFVVRYREKTRVVELTGGKAIPVAF